MQYSEDEVCAKGKEDGRGFRWILWPFWSEGDRKSFPTDKDSEITDLEKDIIYRGNIDIHKIALDWQLLDGGLHQGCAIATANYTASMERHDDAEEKVVGADLIERIGPSVMKKLAIRALEDRIKGYPLPYFRVWVAGLIITAITLSEVWFNYQVFQIFDMEWYETLGMAFGILLAFVILPHFIGVKLRLGGKRLIDILLVLILAAAVLAGFYGLSILRGSYFLASGKLKLLGLEMATGQVVSIMMIFNVVIFLAIAIVAYESTMPDRQAYLAAIKDRDDILREAEIITKEHSEADQMLLDSWIRLEQAHRARINAYEVARAHVEAAIDRVQSLILSYRYENLRNRSGEKKKPSCWSDESGLKKIEMDMREQMPGTLKLLDGCLRCPYLSLLASRNSVVISET